MNKKLIIFLTIILLIVVVSSLFIFESINHKNNNIKDVQNVTHNQIEYTDYNLNSKEVEANIMHNTTIQGIVELKRDDSIYIFGGQHFGEYGYEMEEYTTAYIQINDQTCIDYISSKEYKTDYIEEGDVLICTGDLMQSEYNYNQMDIKENTILVLKEKDYHKMQEEALNNNDVTITIGDMYLLENGTNIEESHIYIKYNLENYRNPEEKYTFPFSEKVYITDTTEVIGNLKEGAEVKIQYNSNEPYTSENAYNGVELKSIEVVK